MGSRRKAPPSFEGRSAQAPGIMRHGPFPGSGSAARHHIVEPLTSPELLENKIAIQAADIEKLARDNHKLAATHVTLRQELIAAEQELLGLRSHIRSLETESNIQIRVLRDKIAKMEVEIKAGEGVKKDLQQAHMEAQSLVKGRQELAAQIQRATQELHKAHADVKNLPDLHAELDSLRKEHQRLRAAFEHEKGMNMEQVEQMQAMEKNLIGMAREVESLRAELVSAENRAHGPVALNPYGSTFVNTNSPYMPPMQVSGAYNNGLLRPHVPMRTRPTGEGQIPYVGENRPVTAAQVAGMAVPAPGDSTVWGAHYDPSRGGQYDDPSLIRK